MKKLTPRNIVGLVAFPLLVAAVIVPVVIWHDELWRVFTSGQRLREWITGWGPRAPLVFVALQVLQVVVFAIPGEVIQVAGGYLFGPWLGLALSVTGIGIGSTIAFFAAKLLGRPFVDAVIPARQREKVEKFLGNQSTKVVFFLLFVIPGIPKDILCYVAGISPLRYPFFIIASTLGRLPGVTASTLIGGAAASDRWGLLGITTGVVVVLFVLGLVFRLRLQAWLERLSSRRDPPEQR